jgi:hypothetical protein
LQRAVGKRVRMGVAVRRPFGRRGRRGVVENGLGHRILVVDIVVVGIVVRIFGDRVVVVLVCIGNVVTIVEGRVVIVPKFIGIVVGFVRIRGGVLCYFMMATALRPVAKIRDAGDEDHACRALLQRHGWPDVQIVG